jgi:hypothetical protein
MDLRGAKSNVMSLIGTYRNRNCPRVALFGRMAICVVWSSAGLLDFNPAFFATNRPAKELRTCEKTMNHSTVTTMAGAMFLSPKRQTGLISALGRHEARLNPLRL